MTKGTIITTTTSFPAGFLWGASTAAHQIEGNNTNSDFWSRENEAGTILPERSGDACDSYHRWRDDLDIVASLGLNSYRFSLEWSRIVPSIGAVSNAELAHYRRMIDGCLERGLTPAVTLHHFTNPRWFSDLGGWRSAENIAHFEEYVAAAATILEGVEWVCTFNEPNMLAMIAAMFDAGEREELVAGAMPPPDRTTTEVTIEAHHRARVLLAERTDAKVGWTIANQNFQAEPGAEEVARAWGWPREDIFIDAARGDDFIGVQAYTRVRIGPDGALPAPDDAERTLTGWEYYPTAAAEAVEHTARLLPDVPIVVTENGIATDDDDRRIDYTSRSLGALREVMKSGVDLRGYFHWSLLDNYEWGSYAPRFGLVAVDRTSFERTVKPSGAWYGSVAAANGATL
ncbi:beta-glucosidase [Agromyces luteolus]|uniref:beta-glucosidase n=1 Tax=Agromyces luteolus TaxID=88373 RepID=A0A7C9MJH2_9MICO|nr:family 1 glycosylhydrolase [Agromyces luteolus]MUN08638.1 family 1 glycosylhydrolase [Agromyces luteolus]GLK27178.1 beta-glucosidase [Agromyces luteolus]